MQGTGRADVSGNCQQRVARLKAGGGRGPKDQVLFILENDFGPVEVRKHQALPGFRVRGAGLVSQIQSQGVVRGSADDAGQDPECRNIVQVREEGGITGIEEGVGARAAFQHRVVDFGIDRKSAGATGDDPVDGQRFGHKS